MDELDCSEIKLVCSTLWGSCRHSVLDRVTVALLRCLTSNQNDTQPMQTCLMSIDPNQANKATDRPTAPFLCIVGIFSFRGSNVRLGSCVGLVVVMYSVAAKYGFNLFFAY